MRVESVDETEIIRRMTEEIYDKDEFERALSWTKEKCKEGFDKNPDYVQKSREQKDADWEFVVKMMCIIKDLMNGNEKLPEGCEEEKLGHNAIAAGFQGQRQWTDFYPNCDFPEALLNTSFDWNGAREPYVLATENDVLNGISMLFGKLLTNTAQIFSDVRTYWSPEAVKKATGYPQNLLTWDNGLFISQILCVGNSIRHRENDFLCFTGSGPQVGGGDWRLGSSLCLFTQVCSHLRPLVSARSCSLFARGLSLWSLCTGQLGLPHSMVTGSKEEHPDKAESQVETMSCFMT